MTCWMKMKDEEDHPSLFVGVSEYKNSDNKEDKIN